MTDEIEKKLDILIKLFASMITKEDSSQTESILKLNKIGIGYRDIAKIIGSSESYVSTALSRDKKKKANNESVKNGKDKDGE